MSVIIGVDKYDGISIGKCLCGAILDEHDFQTSDYVTHPMIWCNCGRYFLDCKPYHDNKERYREWEEDFDFSIYEEVRNPEKHFPGRADLDSYRFYCVNLCKVKRVLGSNMTKFKAKNPLDFETLDKLGKAGVFRFPRNHPEDSLDTICQLMKENSVVIKLAERPEPGDELCREYNIPHLILFEEEDVFSENHMVECNSYNVYDNIPEWVDLSHDGVLVYCEIDHRGKSRIVSYWGD